MTLYTRTPVTPSSVTGSSITNSISGSLGLIPQSVDGGDTDSGFYFVNVPWQVNLNGQLYDKLYVGTKSFISFGSVVVNATPTSPTTNKILLGNRVNTSVSDTYSKGFYYATTGILGSRTLRMRYEGGFKVAPTNITASSITNSILGRSNLQQYSFSGTSSYVELILPWNANFYTTEGTVKNVVRVTSSSYIEFGKHTIENSSMIFNTTDNYLSIGSGFIAVGTGLWAGIEGSFPNRTYRIRYEGYDDVTVGKPATAWEVIFYESDQNVIDVQTETLSDYFSLDQNGWYINGNSDLIGALTNTSGNYNNRGTRFNQTYPSNSFIWEATLYENNTNIIDIQLGSRTNPGTDNHYLGVYSADASLYQFSTISNAGYQITSTYNSPSWATVQNVYTKSIVFPLGTIWQRIRSLYVRDNGIWRLIHPSSRGPVYFFCKQSTYRNDTYGNKGGTGIAPFQNDTFTVPDGITTITVELWGGGGSGGATGSGGDTIGQEAIAGNGGGGGYVKATLFVTPGETLTIRVGGGAWHYAANVIQHPSIALSGSTSANVAVVSRRSDVTLNNQSVVGGIGGSGGGYSAIFRGLTPLLVAAGGGGGGGTNGYSTAGGHSYGGNGGGGGTSIGQPGGNGFSSFGPSSNTGYGGGGGTQTAGGAGGAGATASLCAPSDAESGGYLVGGRGKNNPEFQGNLSGSVLLVDNGTASNPGTNGGAAGGGSGRTNTAVCNSGTIGALSFNTNTLYSASNCGGGGGGGYYGGGGGGVGAANNVIEDTSRGGGGGGGGSNYIGGAASLIANDAGNGRTPGNTTSLYYITQYLYSPTGDSSGVPYNAFAQGGVGYGGAGGVTPVGNFTTINYGTRGENGLVVIYW